MNIFLENWCGWLLDASEFVTRGSEGTGWTPWLRLVYQAAKIAIALSYVAIAASFFALYSKRKGDLLFPQALSHVVVLLVICAIMHLDDVASFYWAPYRLFTLVMTVAAACSVVIACKLPKVVHFLLRLGKIEDVERANEGLRREVREHARDKRELALEYEHLRARLQSLENLIRTNTWVHDSHNAMNHLNEMLSEIEALLAKN